MTDEAKPGVPAPPGLEERKFQLERDRFDLERANFEHERSKSRGFFGFFNSNFGFLITAIVGLGTVFVSYLQLRNGQVAAANQLTFQREVAKDQTALEQTKARTGQDKDERTFQFDLARMLLDRAKDLNTEDERQVNYLRDIVLPTLPTEVSLRILRKMADNAPNERLRARWNDTFVSVQLASQLANVLSGMPSVPQLPSLPTAPPTSTLDAATVLGLFPRLKTPDRGLRVALLLQEAQAAGLDASAQAMLVATALWQTGQLSTLEENLRYSAQRLRQVFGARVSEADAAALAGNPEAIANRVYANRLGNGDEASGDGWRYRGRGYLQTSGRAEYARSGALLGIDLLAEPDKLLDPAIAAREAALRFAQLRDRNSIASIVRLITGSTNGLAEAQSIYERLVPQLPKATEGLTITYDAQRGSGERWDPMGN